MKFRNKPVTIEAEQFWYSQATLPSGVLNFCESRPLAPGQCAMQGVPHCHTVGGPEEVHDGDWIIKAVKGDGFVAGDYCVICQATLFEAMYEPVEE